MSDVSSLVESVGSGAHKRFPSIGQPSESTPPIPGAAKASVARFAAIKARLDAYERSYRLNLDHTTPASQSR